MVSHRLAKFCGHWHFSTGDTVLLVAEEEDSRCSLFNQPLLLISKVSGLKSHGISY